MLSGGLRSLSRAFRSLSGALCFISGFFWFFEIKFTKLLEMISFFPHIILEVGKQQNLGNEFCQTVGRCSKRSHLRDLLV
jgi:hypothetical protein